jgi:uncharacterized protein (DUF302 family)
MLSGQAFSVGKRVALSFDEALSTVQNALKKEGFGMLFDLDPQAKFREKLNVTDFPQFRILGACVPSLGYELLVSQPQLAAFIPCHVSVRADAQNHVFVEAMNPELIASHVTDPQLQQKLRDMGAKMTGILQQLPSA